MGLIFRQSLKASLANYIGVLVGYVNVVYLFPRFMTESEIGIFRFLLEAAMVLSGFALMGSASAMVRYYPKLPRTEHDKGFGFLVFAIPLFGFLLFLAVGSLFRESILSYFRPNASELLPYWPWLVPLVLLMMVGTVTDTYASIRNRITVPKLLREVFLRLGMSAAAVGLGAQWFGFEEAVGFVVIVNAVYAVLNLAYLVSLGRINLKPDFRGIDRILTRDYATYTGFVMIGSFSQVILSRLDFIMVTSMEGIAATGIYSTAFYMAMVIDIPKRSIQQISAPIVADGLTRGDHALVADLYRKTSLNQLLIGSFIFLAVWVNLDTVFDMMPNGEVFRGGTMVFFFIGLGRLIDLSTGIGSTIIYNSDYYRYSLPMGFLTAGLAIAGNLILIPILGISGAAAATAMSYLTLWIYIVAIVKRKSGIQPFTRHSVILCGLFALTLAAHHLFRVETGSNADILWNSALFLAPFAATCLALRISPEVNDRVRRYRFW